MRLTCLSESPNQPSYVLSFRGVTLLLDCGLDLSPTSHFLPLPLVHSPKLSKLPFFQSRDIDASLDLKECNGQVFIDSSPEFSIPDVGMVNFENIDVILISNYNTLGALPYITEELGFRGEIYMTEPTLYLGRLFMEEMIDYIERANSFKSKAVKWKECLSSLPAPLGDVSHPSSWKTLYSRSQMDSCLSKVQLLGYCEKKDIFGLLTVSPVSSGYTIGSANWIISSTHQKIVYISGSSTLTTHPRPLDQTHLRNANVLLLSSLTQKPTHSPDPMIIEFCKSVVETTRLGGNVLVPCHPSGINYDLFECLSGQLDCNGLSNIPLFFISPVADSSLAYSNILAEWLSSSKQNRVYIPEEPFLHGILSRSGRLKSFRNLYDENFSNEYRQPCIVFCGHPSLRFGDVIHFIELWGSNANNTIVFTEPSFSHENALAPFQPLAMKVIHCPIDTSLNFSQAKKLIRELKPELIAIPKVYATPPASTPHRTDLVIDVETPMKTFGRYESIKLPFKTTLESITIAPSLASKLVPVEIRPGIMIATISGNLTVNNNKYELSEINDDSLLPSRKRKLKDNSLLPMSLRKPKEYYYGKLNVKDVLSRLNNLGISSPRLDEESPGCYQIHLDKEGYLIQISQNKTHILVSNEGEASDQEALRKKIRNILQSCLNKF